MLSNSFLDKQRNLLISERSRIINEIKELETRSDYGISSDDAAKEMADYENNLYIKADLDTILKKINKALLAIENKTYGKCSKCQTVIKEDRLELIPYAELCVDCENEEE